MSNDECPVCYEQCKLSQMNPCKHKICLNCFNTMTVKCCPLCRQNVKNALQDDESIWISNISADCLIEEISELLGNDWVSKPNENDIAEFVYIGSKTYSDNEEHFTSVFNEFKNRVKTYNIEGRKLSANMMMFGGMHIKTNVHSMYITLD